MDPIFSKLTVLPPHLEKKIKTYRENNESYLKKLKNEYTKIDTSSMNESNEDLKYDGVYRNSNTLNNQNLKFLFFAT